MSAEVLRTIDAVANSIALAPLGAFVAFSTNDGVYLDSGKKRLFRGTSRRLVKAERTAVFAVTDDGAAVFTTTHQVHVATEDGKVRDLLPSSDRAYHPPASYNAHEGLVSAMDGAILREFDVKTWEEVRTIDVGEELEYQRYRRCSSDGGWTVLEAGARVVVLRDGEFETEMSADRREWFFTGAGLLIGLQSSPTDLRSIASKLPHDDCRAEWPGHFTTWSATSREFRGFDGKSILVRAPESSETNIIELSPPPPSKTPAGLAVAFSPGVNMAVRYRRLQAGLEVLRW